VDEAQIHPVEAVGPRTAVSAADRAEVADAAGAARTGGEVTGRPGAASAAGSGRASWVDWLTTTDHKRIGTLYLVTAFVFFGVGGVMALLMRAELARPGLQIIGTQGRSAPPGSSRGRAATPSCT